ncbi:MAG: hypothetical protein H7Z71_00700 [Moraxellaceae bacterium]|nr:hypothetical protein [Pseudobdellovibrionaceae bacterium]
MSKSIIKKIEKLFEPEMIFEHFSFLSEKSEFEIEDNFKLIENLGYFHDTNPNWNLFFSRLAPFFEMGLLFNDKKLNDVFHNGKIHNCAESQIEMALPQSKIFNIYTTDAQAFLKKIKINSFFNGSKLNCHYVRVETGTAFVLFAKKAEPWNKLQIESLQKSLINYSL